MSGNLKKNIFSIIIINNGFSGNDERAVWIGLIQENGLEGKNSPNLDLELYALPKPYQSMIKDQFDRGRYKQLLKSYTCFTMLCYM